MAASVACSPSSPTHITNACEISTSGVTDDGTHYYLLVDDGTAADNAKSPVFAGNFTWHDYIYPKAASITVRLRLASNDSDVATAGVTVS